MGYIYFIEMFKFNLLLPTLHFFKIILTICPKKMCFASNFLHSPSSFSSVAASWLSSHFPVTKQSLMEFSIWGKHIAACEWHIHYDLSTLHQCINNHGTSSRSQLWPLSGLNREQSRALEWTFLLFWGRLTRNSPPSSSPSSSESSASLTAIKNYSMSTRH